MQIQMSTMNWDQVEGKWDQVRGQLRTKWGKLSDDDLEKTQGRKDRILGKLRERYGDVKEDFETKLDQFISKL